MKKILAFVALALLPVAAGAQAPAAPRAAGAPAGTRGIAVAGYGVVRVPVKTLQVTAQARGVGDEASALAAMRAAGVDDPSIGTYGARISSGSQTLLRGTIHDATTAKLNRIGEAAARYVLAHPGTAVDNVSFTPVFDDCARSEQTARAAAFADARRKADAIAALAGVSIDGVSSVNETGGCPIVTDSPFNSGSNGLDIGTLTSPVTVYEFVTFAISPDSASTRRRPL